MRGETEMHTSILVLVTLRKILQQEIDRLLCRRDEVEGVSVRISLPLVFESLNLKDVRFVYIKEFAAATEHAQCGLIEDHDDVVFLLGVSSCSLNHVIEDPVFREGSECSVSLLIEISCPPLFHCYYNHTYRN